MVRTADSTDQFGDWRRAELLLCARLGRAGEEAFPGAAFGDAGKVQGEPRALVLRPSVTSLRVRFADRSYRRDISQSPECTAKGSIRQGRFSSLLLIPARQRHFRGLRAEKPRLLGKLLRELDRRAVWSG